MNDEIKRRIGDLNAILEEHTPWPESPILGRFMNMVCDGCGFCIDLTEDEARGWELGPPDYCKECVNARNA